MTYKEENNEDFINYITKELAGTKTEKNLNEAYCGESKARNNYTFFSKQQQMNNNMPKYGLNCLTVGNYLIL